MELKDDCTILLDKNVLKVKCFRFESKELGRKLALHENVDRKGTSTVSDIITGVSMFNIQAQPTRITEQQITDGLNKFIKHFTLPVIRERILELEKTTMQEKLNGGKKSNGQPK